VSSTDNRRSPTTKSSESVAPQNSKGKKKFNFKGMEVEVLKCFTRTDMGWGKKLACFSVL
jgi:hypothetical protein